MKKYIPRYHAKLRKVTYTKRQLNKGNHVGLTMMFATVGLGAYLYASRLQPVELVRPQFERVVQAQEISEPIVEEYTPTEGWDGFVQAVHKIAPLYNFPENVVLAQGALESARGNSTFAKERNNYLGIGAYTEDPQKAFHFENSEQCVIAYMELLKRTFPEAWEKRENPEALLKALKVNSRGKQYATDKNYVEKVMSMREWN